MVVIYAIKKLPFLFVGWFWYLGTLVPVIGLVQVAGQSMADRYTYLPSIGIAMILAWGFPLLFPRKDIHKKIILPAGIFTLAILIILTWQQCGYWKNSITLFSHALQVTKDNYQAHSNFGLALVEEGKIEEAIVHYNDAIRLSTDPPWPTTTGGLLIINEAIINLPFRIITRPFTWNRSMLMLITTEGMFMLKN